MRGVDSDSSIWCFAPYVGCETLATKKPLFISDSSKAGKSLGIQGDRDNPRVEKAQKRAGESDLRRRYVAIYTPASVATAARSGAGALLIWYRLLIHSAV